MCEHDLSLRFNFVFSCQEQEQYKLNYATYLESLSEEERKEELLKSQKVISSKRKVVEEVNNGRNAKSKSNKSNKKVFHQP